MPASPFTCVLDIKASLGECPVWSAKEQVLYWVDINAPSLNRFDPATGSNAVMPMPESIGCFALRRSGGFVIALRGGVWLADANGTLGRKVAQAPYDSAHHRFNDGRCDAAGRFFVGSMNEKRDANSATLIRVDPDFRATEVLRARHHDQQRPCGGAPTAARCTTPIRRRTSYAPTTLTRPPAFRRVPACSRSGPARPTGRTAPPWIAQAITGARSIAAAKW